MISKNQAFFLTSGTPFPLVGARRIRDGQILHHLTQSFEKVHVLCMAPKSIEPNLQADLRDFFRAPHLTVTCHSASKPKIWNSLVDLVRPDFDKGYSEDLENTLKQNLKPGDLLWLSRLRMAKYLKTGKKLNAKVVLDEHQVESDLLFDSAFAGPKYWYQSWEAFQSTLYEKTLSYRASAVVTASIIDAKRMQKLSPSSSVKLIPHSLDTRLYLGSHASQETDSVFSNSLQDVRKKKLLFCGDLEYAPHVNGLEWFQKEVLPRLLKALPTTELTLTLASQNETPWVKTFKTQIQSDQTTDHQTKIELIKIETHHQLIHTLSHADVVLFPLRYGRGNRIHLMESALCKVPIVSTGRGADGLLITPGVDYYLAEDADHFTSQIVQILRNPESAKPVIESVFLTVKERFDWQKTMTPFKSLMEYLGF